MPLSRVEPLILRHLPGEITFADEVEGRTVHIRYIAVRDEAGVYRGVLEIAQREKNRGQAFRQASSSDR